MANLNFYGLESDVRAVLSFIYNETDIIIFELYSEYDRELRRFASLKEFESAFNIGTRIKTSPQILLQLWSPSVCPAPEIRKIDLKVKGHSFRYTAGGFGLIQLYLGGEMNNAVVESHYGHWNEAGAVRESPTKASECNWQSLKKLSGRLQRFIRGQAVAKFNGTVILPEAFSKIKEGKLLRRLNTEFEATSVPMELL